MADPAIGRVVPAVLVLPLVADHLISLHGPLAEVVRQDPDPAGRTGPFAQVMAGGSDIVLRPIRLDPLGRHSVWDLHTGTAQPGFDSEVPGLDSSN